MKPSTLSSRTRYHNFSAGPGALPDSVLEEASAGLKCLPQVPLSILGVSHRSSWFTDMVDETEANVRALMGLPQDFECLFLQGGGSLQFSMIAMNFLRGQSLPAAYVDTGYWSAKAIPEARREGTVEVLWSGKEEGYIRLPDDSHFQADRNFAYLHYASNETVEGLQFFREPPCSAQTPRIVDMSSDFFARPVDCRRYDMIYAHAQKNFGPAGVCICLLHKNLLERIPDGLHSMLDYRNHINMRSAYNTPPVFAIYVVLLVTRWLRDEIGGLAAMEALNQEKASRIYTRISSDGFYRCRVVPEARSLMNIAFGIVNAQLESTFLAEAEAAGLYGLEGHRSIGGLRASLYNPVTLDAVDALVAFMHDFERRYG